MREPKWVGIESVLALQERLISLFGGSSGLRDQGLLESALNRPRNLFAYQPGVSIERMAAAYAFGIAKNHPFIDGNKRVAFTVAGVFLGKNGRWLTASEAEATAAMLALSSSEISEDDFAHWLRDRCVRLTKKPRSRSKKKK